MMSKRAVLESKAMSPNPIAASTQKARTRRSSRRLMTGCAIGLALTAMARTPEARAQAFNGTGVFAPGSTGTIGTPSTTQTNIDITSPTAVINWTPTDTAIAAGVPIDFLPSGDTATFSSNQSAYTVLNVIRPTDATRAIVFNGTVNSTVLASEQQVRGGNVWFYAPGGIVVGATGAFNVGSLVLSANEIDTDGGLFGPGGEIRFRNETGSAASAVVINSGAQITCPMPAAISRSSRRAWSRPAASPSTDRPPMSPPNRSI